MTAERHQLRELERAFTTAAISGEPWDEALQQLADLTGSARGQLIGIGGPDFIPFNYVTDMPPKVMEDFISIRGGAPDVSFRVSCGISAPNRISWEADYDEAIPQLRTDDYLDFCRDFEIPFGVQANLHTGAGGLIGLAVLRSRQDGRSTAEQRRLFSLAVPIAAGAVRTRMALEREGALLVAGTLEAMDAAAIVLDGGGSIRAVTPRADRCLSEGLLLEVRDQRLRACNPAERPAVAAAISAALTGRPPRLGAQTMLLRGDGLKEAVAVDLITLPRRDWSLSFRPRLIVLLRLPRGGSTSTELLQAAFHLTRSEAEVADLLSRGLSRSEVAARRGSSAATVAAQLKSIFNKMGVTRESLLVVKARDLLGRP